MLTLVKTTPVEIPARKAAPLAAELFAKMPPASLREIKNHATEKKYARRESIFREEDPAESIWFVTDGHVKEISHSSDGRDQTICMVGVNGIFGVSSFDGGEYGFHGVAETDATVLSFPVGVFQSLMARYPALCLLVVSKVSKLLRQSKNRQSFSQKPAEKRLLEVLVEMAGEFGRTVPLTHRAVAAMAGISPETCSRTFSRLESAGLITAQHGKFTIRNIESLAERMKES